jgi:hypothetical protein
MANNNFTNYGRGRAREKALVLFVVLVWAFPTLAYGAVVDFSGKWSGSSPEMGAVYAVLKQEGTTLTGSAGPSESKQLPITTGKVAGDHLTFEVRMGGGTMSFDLTGAGSELRGRYECLRTGTRRMPVWSSSTSLNF